MNFDVRGYCERLAKADPVRFELREEDSLGWIFYENGGSRFGKYCSCSSFHWAFIGPLADELGAEVNGALTLEAVFAAVCEKAEVGS